MDPGQGDCASATQGREREGHEFARGREHDRRVELHWRHLVRTTHPHGAKGTSQVGAGLTPRHGVELRAPGASDLRGDVRAGAEAVDPEPAAWRQLCAPQGAVADDAGAQKRRQHAVRWPLRQPVGERRRDDGVLGEAPVHVPTGVARLGAEVLGARAAPGAMAAGTAQPSDPHAVAVTETVLVRPAGDHPADDLVSRHGAGPARGEVPFGEVKVGAAHAARGHPQQHVPGCRHRYRSAHGDQRPGRHGAGAFHRPGLHELARRWFVGRPQRHPTSVRRSGTSGQILGRGHVGTSGPVRRRGPCGVLVLHEAGTASNRGARGGVDHASC